MSDIGNLFVVGASTGGAFTNLDAVTGGRIAFINADGQQACLSFGSGLSRLVALAAGAAAEPPPSVPVPIPVFVLASARVDAVEATLRSLTSAFHPNTPARIVVVACARVGHQRRRAVQRRRARRRHGRVPGR